MDIMAWLPAFFLCSAITVSVQGLPVITRDKESKSEHEHHLVKGMHEPSTIEFIFLGQNKNTKPNDAEKYTNNLNSIAINNNENDNKNGISQSDSKDIFTEIVYNNGSNISGALKMGIESFMRASLKEGDWLLSTQKESITRALPKYFYGILPISAFPVDLSEPKETIEELKKENLKNSGFPVRQKTSQPMQVAGPLLFPQSAYAREFDLPFFD